MPDANRYSSQCSSLVNEITRHATAGLASTQRNAACEYATASSRMPKFSALAPFSVFIATTPMSFACAWSMTSLSPGKSP